MDALKKFWNENTALSVGAIVSLLMLSVFFIFQYQQANILKLESRWLVTSGVPILVALLVGGYIKSFKGFGVELEASLHKPVSNLELTATEGMAEIQGDEKRSIKYLHNLSPSQRRIISRLSFVMGRENYYQTYAIEQYIRELDRLKYFEVKSSDGKFVAILPLSDFKINNEISFGAIESFIRSLEEMTIQQTYGSLLITHHVVEGTDLIEALKIMRSKRIKRLAVTDENNVFIGLLTETSIEKRIVDNVLSAKENA
ncbi:CBS domain-containing protein [Shewanella electrodiphila]|uniref:CBS domain-containing protein n=1 Tax=Shewanella electrodiphila TaxID=934143 RepID=A0ABT0KM71_9GAMM|nr:CBS domain-containing protein [Shewanella electrodiphila]MCL1044942.1 CBS domain-containing protein [Shewanella electrodiphila]